MSLSTIMGHAGLSGYAIAAMLVFLAVFASILVRLWLQSRAGGLEEAGRMPLEDGQPVAPAAPGEGRSSANHEETR
jgi:hypothetical protein